MQANSVVPVFLLCVACGSGAEPATSTVPPRPTELATAPAGPSPSVVRSGSFHSDALGVDKEYVVYLPRGYEGSERRFPVIYMLHGMGGDETSWRTIGIADVADQLGLEAIIVMPDGDDSFYANWVSKVDKNTCLASKRLFGPEPRMETYCVEQARYQDYITGDLIHHIDASYRTVADRRSRAIGGLSMGGYGALYLAMRHTALYGAVISHAGVASLLYTGPHPYQKGKATLATEPGQWLADAPPLNTLLRRIWGDDISTWRAHDPAILAAGLAPGALAIYLDCGTADEFLLQDSNQYLHEVLSARGVMHAFQLIDGGRHDGAFWSSRIDDSLRFIQAFFTGTMTRKVGIEPGALVELNLWMPDSGRAGAEFFATGALAWNSHSHPGGTLVLHQQGTADRGSIQLDAGAAGIYSFLWENQSQARVELELTVTLGPAVSLHSWHPAE